MTTEELKAWRIKVCTDLANGVQYQMEVIDRWSDQNAATIAANLFSDWKPECIRIKPEPRKVWIGWYAAGSVMVDNDEAKARFKWHSPVKWQLVEEAVK